MALGGLTHIRPKSVVYAAATWFPPALKRMHRRIGGADARYCHTLAVRHLVKLRRAVPDHPPLSRIVELGPGGSIGTGLAVMLFTPEVESYVALDAQQCGDPADNRRVFDSLLEMVLTRQPPAGPADFPRVWPPMNSYDFPRDLLTDDRIAAATAANRLAAIREDLSDPSSPRNRLVRYAAPWDPDGDAVEPGSADLVFSQAVMEHVSDVPKVHAAAFRFLRPGGVAVHTTDFKSHELTRAWYGHWCVGEGLWRLAVQGRAGWLLNRRAHSDHLRAMESAGFRVTAQELRDMSPAPRSALAPEFRHLTDTDLRTGSSYVIAVKPA